MEEYKKINIVDIADKFSDVPENLELAEDEMEVARNIVELLAKAQTQVYRADTILEYCKLAITRVLITANLTIKEIEPA